MALQSGKIKFFNEKKHFGFIVADNNAGDVFFHGSQIPDRYIPKEGDRVTFELEKGKKGLAAINVQEE